MRKPWHPESQTQPVPSPRQDLSFFSGWVRSEAQRFSCNPILGEAPEGIPDTVPCRWHRVTQVTLCAAQMTSLVACNLAGGIEVKGHQDPGLSRGLPLVGDEPLGRDPNIGFDIKRSRNPASVKVIELAR